LSSARQLAAERFRPLCRLEVPGELSATDARKAETSVSTSITAAEEARLHDFLAPELEEEDWMGSSTLDFPATGWSADRGSGCFPVSFLFNGRAVARTSDTLGFGGF